MAVPARMTRSSVDPYLTLEARTHRRTALVAVQGELDLLTVPALAEVLDDLDAHTVGLRHIVLDLRGVTFMDLLGVRELVRRNELARISRHNLAVVRGTPAVDRLLHLTGVEDTLVLVDNPADLAPPVLTR